MINLAHILRNRLRLVVIAALTIEPLHRCLAGHEMKWEAVPEVVRATVPANGRKVGQTVDKEKEMSDEKRFSRQP